MGTLIRLFIVSKWEAEQVLNDIAGKRGLEVVTLRPLLVYGPGVRANFLRLVKLVKLGVPLPLARLVEGIRIHKKLKNSKLILSGGRVFDSVPEAYTMAKAAVSLGVDASDLIQESMSKDTKDQAMHIKKIVEGERFILVTSACHMLCLIVLFRKLGSQPIPAPMDHYLKGQNKISLNSFFPDAGEFVMLESGFHEYLGLAWAKIVGHI